MDLENMLPPPTDKRDILKLAQMKRDYDNLCMQMDMLSNLEKSINRMAGLSDEGSESVPTPKDNT